MTAPPVNELEDLTVDELRSLAKDAATSIHNAGVELGQAYQDLERPLIELRRRLYRQGGMNAVFQFDNDLGSSRIDLEIVGLLLAAGLERVIVAAQGQGRARWKAIPQFAQRVLRALSDPRLGTTDIQHEVDVNELDAEEKEKLLESMPGTVLVSETLRTR